MANARTVRAAVTVTNLGGGGRLEMTPKAFDFLRKVMCTASLVNLCEHLAAGSGDGRDIMCRNRIPGVLLRRGRLDRGPFSL